MELWTTLLEQRPDRIGELAASREAEGWDGVAVADTQYYLPDPYVMLAAAASATSRLKLSTSTTNPLTRHPSVTAAAMATLQAQSGGRAVLGIGRGDSSSFYVGKSPATAREFTAALRLLRDLLHGHSVRLPSVDSVAAVAAAYEETAGLRWIDRQLPPVPIDVYGSGPRTVAIAAGYADRLTVAVGAEPDRLSAVRRTLLASELPSGKARPAMGAVVLVSPHPDERIARDLIRGFVASHARFTAMSGQRRADVRERDRSVVVDVARSYDMARHGDSGSSATAGLPDEFVDRFAVVGDPQACARRVADLASLGLGHVLLMPPGIDNDPEHRTVSLDLLNHEVLPQVKELLPV